MSLSLSLTLSDPLICTFLLGKNPDEEEGFPESVRFEEAI